MSTLAERLGFAATDRVAIIHADDIGMSHAANEGAFEALAKGPATCGSVMVPCPWFNEAARRAREHPEFDLGVHLTLTAEFSDYRWGPVSARAAVPSLLDAEGHLPRTAREAIGAAKADEIRAELRAQLTRALEAGIDVTHIDAHMGTCFYPPAFEAYVDLALEFRLPAFLVRPARELTDSMGLAPFAEQMRRVVERAASAGMPIVDAVDFDSLGFEPGQGEAHNHARLDALAPGVTYLICHPAKAGEELGAITDSAHAREFERTFYGGEAGRRALAERGIRTVGMRALRELMRAAG